MNTHPKINRLVFVGRLRGTSVAPRRRMGVFTLHRLTVYAVATLVIGCAVIITSLINTPARLSGAIDFPAFYNAGRAARQQPSRLYDRELQMTLYSDIAPLIDPHLTPFFVYTPFFAAIFIPLSFLPYDVAFASWILLSFAMLLGGLKLVSNSRHFMYIAILSVSFLPFYAWCLCMGQTSAFGFFSLALAIYLERKNNHVESGLGLSLLLYKPPLLILVLPMLLITKRWRTLAGLTLGGTLLGIASLALIGRDGIPAYLQMIRGFAGNKTGLEKLTNIEVDAYSFFIHLTGGDPRLALVLLLALLIPLGYWLATTWLRAPEYSWITTIIFTCVLNFYVLLYDSSLLILPAVLMAQFFNFKLPQAFRWLLVSVFVVPWFHVPMVRAWGIQPMTITLIIFGTYILARLNNRQVIGPNLLPSAATS